MASNDAVQRRSGSELVSSVVYDLLMRWAGFACVLWLFFGCKDHQAELDLERARAQAAQASVQVEAMQARVQAEQARIQAEQARAQAARAEAEAARVRAEPVVRTERLPSRVSNCQVDRSGFMGFGSRRRATATITNDGNQAGTFTFIVVGIYPGGGQVEHGRTAVAVPANSSVNTQFDFVQQAGMTSITCSVEAPLVVAVPTTEGM